MSIVLNDGTVLPDLPSDVSTSYPYYTVLRYPTMFDGMREAYVAVFTTTPLVWFPVGMITADPDLPHLSSTQKGWMLYATGSDIGVTEWTLAGEQTAIWYTTEIDEAAGDEVLYSNHDIYFAASVDNDVGPESTIVSTEIYFANSTAKPPFVLPDGTELPALPDGWSEGTPYGMVIAMSAFEVFYATENPMAAVQDSDGDDIILLPSGVIKGWSEADGAWSLPEEAESTEPVLSPFFRTQLVLWSNHDIPYATANDDGTYTIGTEVARKSDVSYRVTEGWMRSIANEARRLGVSTDSLKPADIETILRAVTTP